MFQQIDSQRKEPYLKKFCRYRKKQGNERTELQIYKIKLKMANTLSVMTNVLRNVVSKQRIRYKEKGFNLDLAYICDNIIAMGYPADNIESFYRNRIEDVYKFFEENYHDHYKIYNLCLERSYDVNKFHGRVAVYPFEDHNPPTIELIQKFCYDVDCWLKADPSNVAAIHCKAGKGRTGTMICCYLLYSGIQRTAEDALACYDEKRTKDRKGVTIPSQRRYVQYFSKLIQSGLPYERRTLQFCEIRFTDANLLHNQGVVNCSISLLHDISTLKVQTLQTHTIDFRKNMTLEINNPALSVTGDIKVELTHKSSRKKIFHFWFNTYFVCDTADIEDNGEYRKFVYTLHKNEIDDAHKDREHKYFSEDFKVQVVFLPVNSEGKTNTDINILQQSGSTIHSKVSQDLNCTQHNSILPQNNSSSSNLNYICDQKTSSSASACSLSVNRTSRYMCESGDCTQENERDSLQASFEMVENAQCNKTSTPTSEGTINEKTTNERIKKSTASIPIYSYPMQLLKSPRATLTSTFYQNQNYPILQNHFQLETNKNCFKKQQQLYQQQPNEELMNPSVNASKSSRSRNKQRAGSVNSNCINRHANNNSGNSNSNECSSSSISSHSSSSAAGDNEEDWESGESSPKPLVHNKALLSSPTSNINTHHSLNLYNSSSCIENKIGGDDDDDNNDKYQYFNGNDNEAMTIFYASNLEKTCGCCKSSVTKPCKPDIKNYIGKTELLDNQVSITSEQSQEIIKLATSTAAASANNKKPILKTNSLISSAITSTSISAHEPEATCSFSTLQCGSSTGLASTSKQKLKIKLKKNKIKLSQKFQWFQKYFRNDPIDFCENFVQQTTAMRRSSNCSVASRSHKLSTTTPPPQLGCFSRLSSTLPLYVAKPTNLDIPTEQAESVVMGDIESVEYKNVSVIPPSKAKSAPTSVSAASLSTADNFDFYSSICDKQLSFNNSPCKSSRSLVDIVMTSDIKYIKVNCALEAQGSMAKQTETNDINEKYSKELVVVAAKPAKTNAIGFNVASLPKTTDSCKINCNSNSQVAINSDQSINNTNSKDLILFSTPPDESKSILFPLEFPNLENELEHLEKVNNSASKTFAMHKPKDEKNRMENNKTGRETILSLVIIKEINNLADQTHNSQISPGKTKSHSQCSNVYKQVGGGHIVSDSSNSSSSGFCTSECYTNNSSSSVCSCNPFALDLERHAATEESNENTVPGSSKTALTKSNVNNITRDVDVIGVLERTLKQFVDY